jgi:hypothetical protein
LGWPSCHAWSGRSGRGRPNSLPSTPPVAASTDPPSADSVHQEGQARRPRLPPPSPTTDDGCYCTTASPGQRTEPQDCDAAPALGDVEPDLQRFWAAMNPYVEISAALPGRPRWQLVGFAAGCAQRLLPMVASLGGSSMAEAGLALAWNAAEGPAPPQTQQVVTDLLGVSVRASGTEHGRLTRPQGCEAALHFSWRRARLRDGCSASAWTAPDESGLLTLDGPSVQTAPDRSSG